MLWGGTGGLGEERQPAPRGGGSVVVVLPRDLAARRRRRSQARRRRDRRGHDAVPARASSSFKTLPRAFFGSSERNWKTRGHL